MNSPAFAIQKSTQKKFYFPRGLEDSAARVLVVDLPSHATLSGVLVVCDTCSQRFPASVMYPTAEGPGLTCAACKRAQDATSAPADSGEADTLEKALRKAKALLRLAQSGNTAEAASAAAKAQEIIDRYRLNIAAAQLEGAASVGSDEPIENFKHDPLNPKDGKLDRWKDLLAVTVAKLNQCTAYHSGPALVLVGRASDVSTARYLFTYLVQELERLASTNCKGCGRSYWNNFRLGAVETVSKRLKEARAATVAQVKQEATISSKENALVLVEQSLELMTQRTAQAEEWAAKNLNLRKASSGGRARFNPSARDAGRAAGHSIAINNSSGALNGGARQSLNG